MPYFSKSFLADLADTDAVSHPDGFVDARDHDAAADLFALHEKAFVGGNSGLMAVSRYFGLHGSLPANFILFPPEGG